MAIETLGAALRQINRLFADGVVTGFSDAQLLERFVSGHDAAAFEALVARHGPMVLSVCRGILKDPNDAEDAFQATFLILVKKSGDVPRHECPGALALSGGPPRGDPGQCRRRPAAGMRKAGGTDGCGNFNVGAGGPGRAVAGAPRRDRPAAREAPPGGHPLRPSAASPRSRAAGELRLSERTLQRRLSEGRERLKARLIRRGLAPEGGMLGAVFLREARVAVPAGLGRGDRPGGAGHRESHDDRRGRLGGGQGIDSGGAQDHVAPEAHIGLDHSPGRRPDRLGGVGRLGLAPETSLRRRRPRARIPPRRKAEAAVPQPGPNPPETPGKVAVRRAGARAGRAARRRREALPRRRRSALLRWQPYPSHESATTGPDGRFQFLADRGRDHDRERETPIERTVVAAAAPNYGVAWVEVPAGRPE